MTASTSRAPLTTADYPLSVHRPDLLRTPTGKTLDDLTMAAVVSGDITSADLRISPETLALQGQLADAAGRRQLAANFQRASEMTTIPDAEVSGMYNALRPNAATAPSSWRSPRSWRTTYSAPPPAPPSSARRPRSTRPRPPARPRRPEDDRRSTTAPEGPVASQTTSMRTEVLEDRPVNLDGFVEEWPEKGLVAMESATSTRSRACVSRTAGSSSSTAAPATSSTSWTRSSPTTRSTSRRLRGRDGVPSVRDRPHARRPADLARRRRRRRSGADPRQDPRRRQADERRRDHDGHAEDAGSRRTPANQAHSTSARDNPIQVAADAAEGAVRGFAELETTLGVVRYAPLVAIGLQVGGQVGRGGVLTQCALEEATELTSACAASPPTPRRHRAIRNGTKKPER